MWLFSGPISFGDIAHSISTEYLHSATSVARVFQHLVAFFKSRGIQRLSFRIWVSSFDGYKEKTLKPCTQKEITANLLIQCTHILN